MQLTNDLEKKWNLCLHYIRERVDATEFDDWFKKIKPHSIDANRINIQVPNELFKNYLEKKHVTLLREALSENLGSHYQLFYMIKPVEEVSKQAANSRKVFSHMRQMQPQHKLGIEGDFKHNLNYNASFERFIIGDINQSAYQIATEVCKQAKENREHLFNPLVIFGRIGVGKTHIVNATGLDIKRDSPEKRVLYTTADTFLRQYMAAGRTGSVDNFTEFYKSLDVLILDDIQFLAGVNLKKTQNTFFTIFDYLHRSGKQIILTSDTPLSQIKDIQDRLLSRLRWGVSIELLSPDKAMLLEVAKQKVKRDGSGIDLSVLEFLSECPFDGFREIEGILTTLQLRSLTEKKEITLSFAREVVNNYISTEKKQIDLETIIKVVCQHFKLTEKEIFTRTKRREVVEVRQIAMYLARKYTNSTLANIAKRMGKKDHSTVIHAVNTVSGYMDTDNSLKTKIVQLKQKLT